MKINPSSYYVPKHFCILKPPEKPDAWTGVRDTLQYGNECPQSDYFSPKKIGNEDCLYLNVFVPVGIYYKHLHFLFVYICGCNMFLYREKWDRKKKCINENFHIGNGRDINQNEFSFFFLYFLL